jgi:hypothetical protein
MPCGVTRIEAKLDAEGVALFELEQRIFAIPATTPDGWRLKARITAHIIQGREDDTYEDKLVRNLLADLLRPAEAVSAQMHRTVRPVG